MVFLESPIHGRGVQVKKSNLVAIDLAKSVFQVCVLDEHNKVLVNRKLRRAEVTKYIVNLEPTTIAMEACYSSHYWGRVCQDAGHTVRLIPAQHVKPFVRGNKNDANDALAIAEAAQRPFIRPVPVKTRDQQDMQSLHRIRERIVRQRVGLINQTRGLLADYGIVAQTGVAAFGKLISELCDPESTRLSPLMKQELLAVRDEFDFVSTRLDALNAQIKAIVAADPVATRLMTIPGVGVIGASALSSAIGRGQQFRSARDLAVWLGLTPKHSASGATLKPGGISKRGNRYLRKILCHGARSAISVCKRDADPMITWARQVAERRGTNKATVALANRVARLIWTLLQKDEDYRAVPAAGAPAN